MGVSTWLVAGFYARSYPDTLVADTVAAVRDAGFRTHQSQPDRIQRYEYRTDGDDGGRDLVRDATDSLETVVDRIERQRGKLGFWYPASDFETISADYSYDATFEFDHSTDEPPVPLHVKGPNGYYFDEDERGVSRDVVLDEADALVDAVATLVERIGPSTAFVSHFNDHGRAEGIPDGAPPEHGLERMPFVLVCGEPWFEPLGGRTRLLEAPAYETRHLETGAVLLRSRDHPNQRADDTAGSPDALFEYLFEHAR